MPLAALACGCGNPAYRAAERGDQARLRAEIAPKHERGQLENDDAACLAHAVASRELVTAKDESSASTRIREASSCAVELDDALEERMKKHDGAGAEAALALLDAGELGDRDVREHLTDPDDRWRALGVRTLRRESDQKARQKAFLDPSPRVRRAAIRASSETQDPADLDPLFETARVDPELVLRNAAIRAMSAIVRGEAAKSRVAEHVLRLRDLWASGDDAIREDVAVGWALAPAFGSGGRDALRVEIANGAGPGAIAAAAVVVRTAGKDAELTASASALLARTVVEGSRRDRLHAIASARPKGAELDALRKASREEDLDIRLPALARLMESKPEREEAVRALEAIAGQGVRLGPRGSTAPATEPAPAPGPDDARLQEHASRARHALALAGDLRIQAWIEQDLTDADPKRRLGAASALAALGRPARAAPLLADADASVRTRAACTILVAVRR